MLSCADGGDYALYLPNPFTAAVGEKMGSFTRWFDVAQIHRVHLFGVLAVYIVCASTALIRISLQTSLQA